MFSPREVPEGRRAEHVSIEALVEEGIIDSEGKAIINPPKDIKTIEQGAATQIWCATNPGLEDKGGVYCEDANFARLRDVSENSNFTVGKAASAFGVLPYAVDPISASRLWELSEQYLWMQNERVKAEPFASNFWPFK